MHYVRPRIACKLFRPPFGAYLVLHTRGVIWASAASVSSACMLRQIAFDETLTKLRSKSHRRRLDGIKASPVATATDGTVLLSCCKAAAAFRLLAALRRGAYLQRRFLSGSNWPWPEYTFGNGDSEREKELSRRSCSSTAWTSRKLARSACVQAPMIHDPGTSLRGSEATKVSTSWATAWLPLWRGRVQDAWTPCFPQLPNCL